MKNSKNFIIFAFHLQSISNELEKWFYCCWERGEKLKKESRKKLYFYVNFLFPFTVGCRISFFLRLTHNMNKREKGPRRRVESTQKRKLFIVFVVMKNFIRLKSMILWKSTTKKNFVLGWERKLGKNENWRKIKGGWEVIFINKQDVVLQNYKKNRTQKIDKRRKQIEKERQLVSNSCGRFFHMIFSNK